MQQWVNINTVRVRWTLTLFFRGMHNWQTPCNRELHQQDHGTQRCRTEYGGLPLSKSLISISLCTWGLILRNKYVKTPHTAENHIYGPQISQHKTVPIHVPICIRPSYWHTIHKNFLCFWAWHPCSTYFPTENGFTLGMHPSRSSTTVLTMQVLVHDFWTANDTQLL